MLPARPERRHRSASLAEADEGAIGGVAVALHVYKGLEHSEAGTPFFAQAHTFLAQRFKNLPFRNRCANIGPGNSIAPVRVPAS